MKQDIKKLPEHDRPREKAVKYGIEYLSNVELLALVLRCGSRKMNVIELSQYIMNKYYSFNNLVNCCYEELVDIEGIKQAKAIEILAIMEIAKRVQKSKLENIKEIRSPKDIYDYFSVLLKEEKQEIFMVVYLNIKSHIIRYEKLFVGGISSSIVDVNLIFKKAISYGASKIICLHNHPSGDPTPSKQDLLLFKKINNVGAILEIKIMDHIIIGKGSYYSFEEMNL